MTAFDRHKCAVISDLQLHITVSATVETCQIYWGQRCTRSFLKCVTGHHSSSSAFCYEPLLSPCTLPFTSYGEELGAEFTWRLKAGRTYLCFHVQYWREDKRAKRLLLIAVSHNMNLWFSNQVQYLCKSFDYFFCLASSRFRSAK